MMTHFFAKNTIKSVSLESTLGFDIHISVVENPNHFGEIGFTLLKSLPTYLRENLPSGKNLHIEEIATKL